MKKIQIIALITLMIGWFPFMFVSIYGMHNKDLSLIIMFSGFIICLMSALILTPLFSNKALWLKQDEFDKEKDKFVLARKKYEQATLEFVKKQEVKN